MLCCQCAQSSFPCPDRARATASPFPRQPSEVLAADHAGFAQQAPNPYSARCAPRPRPKAANAMARDGDRYTLPSRAPAPFTLLIIPKGVGAPSRPLPQRLWSESTSRSAKRRNVRFVIPTALLLRDCFGDDLTYFVAEWRAEDVHARIGGRHPHVCPAPGGKAPAPPIL